MLALKQFRDKAKGVADLLNWAALIDEGIVIGKDGRRIPEDRAHEYIAGLTIMNEGSLRDFLRHAKFNVTQGKNFEHSGSLGPWLVTPDELDPDGGLPAPARPVDRCFEDWFHSRPSSSSRTSDGAGYERTPPGR